MSAALGFRELLKQVARPSLTSGALSGGMALLTGANPLQALATGAVDTAASAIPLAGLRKLSPKSYGKRTLINKETGEQIIQQGAHPLETPLNIATSLGTSFLTAPLIYGGQQEQIEQQLLQRSVVNQLPLQEELMNLSPGTMSQVSSAEFQQLLNQMPQGSWADNLNPYEQQMLQGVLNPRLM